MCVCMCVLSACLLVALFFPPSISLLSLYSPHGQCMRNLWKGRREIREGKGRGAVGWGKEDRGADRGGWKSLEKEKDEEGENAAGWRSACREGGGRDGAKRGWMWFWEWKEEAEKEKCTWKNKEYTIVEEWGEREEHRVDVTRFILNLLQWQRSRLPPHTPRACTSMSV